MEIYKYRTGVVSTEQDFVTQMDTFLTSVIGGWSKIDTISDTSSNRDFVWSSEGESSRDTGIEGADPIVIRIRAESDYLNQYTYGTYPSFAAKTFEIFNSTFTRVATGSVAFRYWMFGNKNFVCYTIKNGSYFYIGYLGLIDSYYIPEKDPLPILNRGQAAGSYYLTGTTTYGAMHNVTTSGLEYYEGFNNYYTYMLQYDVGNRSNDLIMFPIPLYADSSAPLYEVRGNYYGVYHANGNRFGNPSVLTTSSGVFLGFKLADNNGYSFVLGPVASGIGDFPGLVINSTGYSS